MPLGGALIGHMLFKGVQRKKSPQLAAGSLDGWGDRGSLRPSLVDWFDKLAKIRYLVESEGVVSGVFSR